MSCKIVESRFTDSSYARRIHETIARNMSEEELQREIKIRVDQDRITDPFIIELTKYWR